MRGHEADEIHVYSGMPRGWTAQQRHAMTQRLASDTKGQYSYSKDFGSATVVLVDEEEERRIAREQDEARRTTTRGFVYPAPTRPQDRQRHPGALSESRKADLQVPWADPADQSAVEEARGRALALRSGRGAWSQPSSIGGSDAVGRGGAGGGAHLRGSFGFVGPAGERLDALYFTSVHIGGEKEAEERKAKQDAERASEAAKVITDPRFRPHVPSSHPA